MLNQKKVLIVSSDQSIKELLKMHLEAEGCLVDVAENSCAGKSLYKDKLHDLIVLDMATTDCDCIELAGCIREIKDTKIVFLTEEDKQHGVYLDIVMDNANNLDIRNIDQLMDIVAEQFNLHKRQVIQKQEKGQYSCGDFRLNIANKRAYIKERELKLSDMAMNLLIYMVLNEGNYISKKELYQKVWNNPVSQNDSTVMAHIRNLRRELRDNDVAKPLYIHTKRGVGYMFKCNKN